MLKQIINPSAIQAIFLLPRILSRVGWRLLNESNPLVSAVMKAKYYPKTTFLNAEVGANPSYVWCSIMAALRAFREGARRKIGNGLNTTVWRTPWLPSLDDGCVTTHMPDHLCDITVSNLMVTGEQRWDIDVLNDICDNKDVELIKRIPLPLSDKVDSWFWILKGGREVYYAELLSVVSRRV